MAITQDIFGNTFAGNFIQGDLWNPDTLLATLRTALGSNDRANILKNDINTFRIDWRPNINEETLTGAIPILTETVIYSGQGNSFTLAANSRMGFSQWQLSGGFNVSKSAILLKTGIIDPIATSTVSQFFDTANFWAVANSSSISYFVFNSPTDYLFISTGVLKESPISYPDNRYGIFIKEGGAGNQATANSEAAGVIPLYTSTSIANYPHTKKSDSTNTNSEVELYLRRELDNIPLGWVPNIFKWKVDGLEVEPTIGNTVRLNMVNATGEYVGQGNIFCKVVGRLGNTSETDLTGDYLLMRIAS